MQDTNLSLYIEINEVNFIFLVGKQVGENNYQITYKLETKLEGIKDNRITDLDKTYNAIKENIYLLEQKLNYTFKEIILILENFNPTFINLSGYKRLNGSQVLRENITYIINTLKSYIDRLEPKKTVLHIFNSKFFLDNKKIENLPIGLFGDFYSHELSFSLMNINDYKNLINIFDKCNLKIKKILLKSFLKGACLSNNNSSIDTFYSIKIDKENSKIFYFENNSLKFEQYFNFGSDIILKDISKITSLKKDTVIKILDRADYKNSLSEEEILEKDLFEDNYRKIKKKLIYQIAHSRIKELVEIMIHKNVNFHYYNKTPKIIFLENNNENYFKNLKEIFKVILSMYGIAEIKSSDVLAYDNMIKDLNQLVHFGWKKEAIPVTRAKKSIISRIFDSLFS